MDIHFHNQREKIIQLADIMLGCAREIEKTLETIPADRHKEFKEFVESDPRMKEHSAAMEKINIGA